MLERLGLPDVSRHRRFITSMAVDAVGTGVFMPVSVLYFLATTSLSLPQVGLALSVAAAVAVPAVLVVGHVVDKVGAKQVLLAANAIEAAGFAGYLVAHSYAAVQGVTIVVAIGQAAFWSSYSPMVAAITLPGERELWFGFIGALRNVGFAAGGLLAGLAISIGTTTAYRAMVAANVLSYLLALVLLSTVRAHKAPAPPVDERHVGWAQIIRDRPYYLLVLSNLAYALCSIALNYVMPVYAVETLHLPGWVTGTIFTINTVLVGFGQSFAVRKMRGHVRWRIIGVANLGFAAGFMLMALAGHLAVAPAVTVMLVAVGIYTVGEVLAGPVLTTIATDSRPDHLRGRYMSVYQLSWTVASIIAPVTFSWLLAQGRSPVWVVLIVVTVIGTVLARIMSDHLPLADQPVTNSADVEMAAQT
ncbi:MFS transporter [Leekyejoonella antrihumi]|uniref:MFS transporter n=1 Tax=Leekyejoonella antrihumi TaxID=1660198 RepID=A0A563E0F5_9MICO|nr:MFS transporter [Leekyejoonella antrihumi]TWP36020.1 MFS transporter [Leekyejoonella antrihumi]